MITAGIDSGAKNTQSVVLKNGQPAGRGFVPTRFDPARAAEQSLIGAAAAAGVSIDGIRQVGATGSGKDAVDSATCAVSDITAIARWARFFYPACRTVVDVGAEEGRAVRIDESGEPVDFAINDKCAAGSGAFIEAMARVLEVSLEEMGALGLQSDKKIPLNAQCAVFAESEVVGLIHARAGKSDISRAIHDAVAGRIASLIRRIGIREEVVLVGGMGRNQGFIASLQRELQIDHLCVPEHPEFAAAAGAAVAAAEKG